MTSHISHISVPHGIICNMNPIWWFKKIKKELFYIRKILTHYGHLDLYIYNRFFQTPEKLFKNRIFRNTPYQPQVSIHMLTGTRDVPLAMWSLASFHINSGISGKLYIHSDGSITEQDIKRIQTMFPDTNVLSEDTIDKSKFSVLPRDIQEFYAKNKDKVFLKKLLLPYIVSEEPITLVIDSDLIWFKEADEILQIIRAGGTHSLMTKNNGLCPVYFRDGTMLAPELAQYNAGLVVYTKNNFSLEKLSEYFSRLDTSDYRNDTFIEQGAYAYCLSNIELLDDSRYSIKKLISSDTIVRHYTSPRRPLFFIEGIPNLLRQYITKQKNIQNNRL